MQREDGGPKAPILRCYEATRSDYQESVHEASPGTGI